MKNKNQIQLVPSPLRSFIGDDKFTLDEQILMNGMQMAIWDFWMTSSITFYCENPSYFENVINAAYKGGHVPMKVLKDGERWMLEVGPKFYHGLSDMQELPSRDQNLILGTNYPLVLEFIEACCEEDVEYTNDSMARIKKALHDESLKENDVAKALEQTFERLSIGEEAKPFKYEEAFGDGFWQDAEDSRRHSQLFRKLKEYLGEDFKTKVDETLLVLISFVLLYSTDTVKLSHPERASKVQDKYAKMLYRYFKTRDSRSAASKFGRIMTVCGICQELVELKKRHQTIHTAC